MPKRPILDELTLAILDEAGYAVVPKDRLYHIQHECAYAAHDGGIHSMAYENQKIIESWISDTKNVPQNRSGDPEFKPTEPWKRL